MNLFEMLPNSSLANPQSTRPQGKDHGIGLGLTICKALVDQLKGKITCKSVVGRGTKFVIELPINSKVGA